MSYFLPLGGAEEIGATCYYLNIDNTGIILDCGTHPRKKGMDALPQFSLIKQRQVDVALISHAHQDHIDSLPYLVQQHPYIRVLTTPQTRAVAELTLHNSVSILQEQLKDETAFRPYTHDEVDLLIQSVEWRAYKEEFLLEGYRSNSIHPITASFHDAGHILGSAGILLKQNEKKIFFTGDINLEKQALLTAAELPQEKIDKLILECTHGATDSVSLPPWWSEAERFTTIANKIIQQGGSILIPVFALGKLQEVMTTLWLMMEKGRLSHVDIFTGGIGKKISAVYDKNRYVVPRINQEFEVESIPQKNLFEVEHIEDFFHTPCIVLASSGMIVEGTRSFKLAQRWLTQHKSAIFTVGYMDTETPGYKIARAKQGDTIQFTEMSEPQQVHCAIEKFRFSAHSRREGLLEIVRRLQPEKVILVHGDTNAVDSLGYSILNNFPATKVHVAEVGKQIEL